jgi:hypothetical protein
MGGFINRATHFFGKKLAKCRHFPLTHNMVDNKDTDCPFTLMWSMTPLDKPYCEKNHCSATPEWYKKKIMLTIPGVEGL